jgi:type VI protein secretion system component VasK
MTTFAYEFASVLAAQMRARPGDPAGPYCMPWYVVLGEPGSGRSSAIRAINLSWPHGEGPLTLGTPTQLCSYWLPEKAVFIEPGPQVVGPDRQPSLLRDLCTELKETRPREPLDGIVLVLSAIALADLDPRDEVELGRISRTLRSYLSEIYAYLDAEVPIYVVLTAYDTLWGFGDSFQWTLNRRDEEPWGFALPVALEPTATQAHVAQEMEGLRARIESVCFAKLSADDPPDARSRAFQHLAEMRALLAKVGAVLHALTMVNAFERTPWVRSLVVGSAMPGTGDRLRYMAHEFSQMGLFAPAQSRTPQPGGLPMHGLLDHTLWPERDIVPLRSRWRADGLLMVLLVVGILAWLGTIGAAVVFALI